MQTYMWFFSLGGMEIEYGGDMHHGEETVVCLHVKYSAVFSRLVQGLVIAIL